MYISKQLKERNIAEYLIYMWQIEDLIRANGLDMGKIGQAIVVPSQPDKEKQRELFDWYENLVQMMRNEQVAEKGHLQINKNIITDLTGLHNRLLRSPAYPFYTSAYYKALPFIVELRSKGGKKDDPELETCFEALYGVFLLRLQKKEVSPETTKAVATISSLLSMLANYYDKENKGELEF